MIIIRNLVTCRWHEELVASVASIEAGGKRHLDLATGYEDDTLISEHLSDIS